MGRLNRAVSTGALLTLLILLTGCEQADSIREAFRDSTPHERYAASLAEAGLDVTALGRAWTSAAETALSQASNPDVPFRSVVYFAPDEPQAVAYRFQLSRGEVIYIDLTLPDTVGLFVDLYRLRADTTRPPLHLAHIDSTGQLEWRVRRTAEYALRLQPELLRGGRYTLSVQTAPSLAFPVSGRDRDAIRSFFGASRDGGRRSHHGVDIFAPRGTPVVAAADGYVARANVTNLGGKVVWVRTSEGAHYYAHLDSQIVRPRQQVRTGDTLGLVGNTGNARTTPPHLHFGIYSNGPLDPLPFIDTLRPDPPDVTAKPDLLGRFVRIDRATRLRAAPTPRAPEVAALPRHTVVYLTAARQNWYYAVLPDGTPGYVPASRVQTLSAPLRHFEPSETRQVRHRLIAQAPIIDSIGVNTSAPVLGTFGSHLFVETPNRRRGWVVE